MLGLTRGSVAAYVRSARVKLRAGGYMVSNVVQLARAITELRDAGRLQMRCSNGAARIILAGAHGPTKTLSGRH
jgi:hypothetical protein